MTARWRRAIPGALLQRECAEQLVLMTHRDQLLGERFERERVERDDVPGPRRVGSKSAANHEPYVAALRARRLREDPRHPGEEILGIVGVADPLRELREHLVRGRALPIDEPVGETLDALAHGLEGNRHDRGRGDRQWHVGLVARADERADPDHDGHVHGRDEPNQPDVEQRLVDDDVELVEPVLEHREGDGYGETDPQGHEHHRPGDVRDRLLDRGGDGQDLTIIPRTSQTAPNATSVTTQRICSRSSPTDRRYRTISAPTDASAAPNASVPPTLRRRL